MISQEKLVEEFAKVVEEIFSHRSMSMDIRVKGELGEIPTIKVEYEAYIAGDCE